MLDEETFHKLNEMKLYGFVAAFHEYLDEKKPDKLSFEERFGMMVDREWNERQSRRLKRQLAAAKLRQPACVEDVNFRHPRKLERSVVQRLATGKWLVDHDNILISGPTGIGKTWLACAFANQACRQGFNALYARVPRLLHSIAMAKADGSYSKVLTRLAATRVLVLDDFGLVPLGAEERYELLEVLEDRCGRSSTVVTSQLPIKKWHGVIGDPTVADAVLDRLVHGSHRLELSGPTMRDPEEVAEEPEVES